MAPKLKIGLEGATIVVRGAFNPAIFSPLWLQQQGLIDAREMDDQQLDLVTQDLAVFRAGWLRVQVTPEGFQANTQTPEELDLLRDVVVGALGALSHTPIASIGLNRDYHLMVDTMKGFHAIGDHLAPKSIWENKMLSPGMRSIVMWGVRPDDYTGHIQVSVEPSLKMPNAVYLGVNDHYSLATLTNSKQPSRETLESAWDLSEEVEISSKKIGLATEILNTGWAASLDRAEEFAIMVNGLAKEEE